MKRHQKIKHGVWISIICACLIVTLVGGASAIQNWRPLRERGSAPSSVSNVSKYSEAYSSEKFANFLICGIDNTNKLTDVIMVAGYDGKSNRLSILQIPRDTYAGNDVPSHKYNAIYGNHAKDISGMETLRARVESDFGIKINHYAAVTTKGLRNIVDAVGGVDLVVPINMNYDDKAQNLHIHLKKGPQHLDGSAAEQFVRFRKGWSQGDLGRLSAQRIFLAALTQKLKTLNVWDIVTKAAPAIKPPDFLTDMSGYEMIGFYNSMKLISLSDAMIYIMPGEPFKINGIDYYSVHKADLLNILNQRFVPHGVSLSINDIKIKQKADYIKSNGQADNFENILSDQQ